MSNNQLTNHQFTNQLCSSSIGRKLSNSLMNQLTNPLINKFTSSPINLLQRARKKNKNMQNEPNLKITRNDISTCNTITYGNLIAKIIPKNKAKQSQFKPNFSPKLGSFSSKLALFLTRIGFEIDPKIEAVKKAPLFRQGFHKNMFNDRQHTRLLITFLHLLVSAVLYRKSGFDFSLTEERYYLFQPFLFAL